MIRGTIPVLATVFAGVATWATLGFVPAIIVGGVTGVAATVGVGVGAGVGAIGAGVLGSIFGGLAAKGEGAAAGGVFGLASGAVIGSVVGGIGGGIAGYNFTHDAVERHMNDAPAVNESIEIPSSSGQGAQAPVVTAPLPQFA